MNKKIVAIIVVAILAVSIGLGIVFYSMNVNKVQQQQGTYVIIGTLAYAPGHAIYPGISVSSIDPTVSPLPSSRTFIEPMPSGPGLNETVSSFVFLNFQPDLYHPANSIDVHIDFPTGFDQGNVVKITGEMSYNTNFQAYVMNATNISPYS